AGVPRLRELARRLVPLPAREARAAEPELGEAGLAGAERGLEIPLRVGGLAGGEERGAAGGAGPADVRRDRAAVDESGQLRQGVGRAAAAHREGPAGGQPPPA